MNAAGYRVAVVGASGAVGSEMRRLLLDRRFPVGEPRFFTSSRTAGRIFDFGGRFVTAQPLGDGCFDGVDLALFSAGAAVSREWAPRAVAAGALVVDNSSAFRTDREVPLVVPEINAFTLPRPPALVANPNCSTIQMVMALKPLHDLFGLTRVIVATYQSTSGAGRRAMEELRSGAAGYLEGNEPPPERFPHAIAFNLLAQVDTFGAEGYTREEWKMVNETRRILDLPDLPVTPTCVRAPVFRSHSEMVWAAFHSTVDVERAREALRAFPGIVVEDDPASGVYPEPRRAEGRDEVFVGRLRRDPSDHQALVMWVVSDNLIKGAALNAVQIAERVLGVPAPLAGAGERP